MATEMQLKVSFRRNRVAAWTLRKKKQQHCPVFFDVIFDVYTHVDNSERARASD